MILRRKKSDTTGTLDQSSFNGSLIYNCQKVTGLKISEWQQRIRQTKDGLLHSAKKGQITTQSRSMKRQENSGLATYTLLRK